MGRHTGAVLRAFLLALALIRAPAMAADGPSAGATALREALALYQDHRYSEAEPLFQLALETVERAPGANDLLITSISIYLAECYWEQGNYAEAEQLHKRVLAMRERVLGPDHPDVAASLNNLAGVYRKEGRNADAEPLYTRALRIREEALGSDDPHLGEALNNLAALYRDEGRYAAAEPLYTRALAIVEKAFGPGHPDVATVLDNLGTLYLDEGRYTDAEPLYTRALRIREEALGSDHPDVAEALNNLAALYRGEGRYAEAEPLYKRALAIREKAFGPDHPDIAYSLNNLAAFYQEQGRISEAEALLTRALAMLEKALGPDNADVANSMNNLAELYRGEGRYAEAESLYKRALPIAERALGLEHPDTARIVSNLAELYRNNGFYTDAEALEKRALAIREKALGPDHPDVAHSLNNLAELYREKRRYPEAETRYKRALPIIEKAVGADHPDYANALNNLAAVYSDEDRGADAEKLYRRALTIREKALGPDHPDVANSLNNLAELYREQGHYTEAEELHTRALAIRERALGSYHLDVGMSLDNLARVYSAQNRLDRAELASSRAVEVAAKHLSSSSAQRSGAALSEQRHNRFFFTNYIRIATAVARLAPERRQEITAETFRVAQMAQVSKAGVAVAALGARLAAGGGSRSEVIRERQDLVQQWQWLDDALMKAASRLPKDRKPAEEASLRSTLANATRRLDALDARIVAEFPAYAELSNPRPLTMEAVQRLIGSDEVLLLYLVTEEGSWLWVLRQDNVALCRIEIGANALAEEVKSLRARLDPKLTENLPPFPVGRAHELYQKILGPAEPLLADAGHLLIIPDGALESLPMSVLVTKAAKEDPQSPADHRDVAWLGRDYAMTVLPVVSSLRVVRELAASGHSSDPFLGIGDPVLTGPPAGRAGATLVGLYRGAAVDIDEVRSLPPLRETAGELRVVAKTLGASEEDLLLGQLATKPVLRRRSLDRYKIIQFATHGLLSGEVRGLAEPALVLTPPLEPTPDDDGLLTASEIATLKLNADWVVLSACNTAGSDGTPDAGGLSGLARAFFYAGARSVLVSHWSTRSQAAFKLTTGTFAQLAQDPSIGRAEALRRSMMAMLDPANPPEFAHPSAWAPFVLAGEGGPGR